MTEDFEDAAKRETKETAMKTRNEVTQDASRIRQWAIVRTMEHEMAHLAKRQLAHQQERETRKIPSEDRSRRTQELTFDESQLRQAAREPRNIRDSLRWETRDDYER